jgi:hypothetical protein
MKVPELSNLGILFGHHLTLQPLNKVLQYLNDEN